jgi:hypothetical protein
MPMLLAPPPPSPPRVAVDDGDGRRRLHQSLRLWTLTAITIVVTGWLCTYGAIASVLALVVAKHVLVAILAMGLGVDQTRQHQNVR